MRYSLWLHRKIDNTQIIVFRIGFGLLVTAECWGAILTGWVKRTFVEPTFTFTFFGFEWTQFLLGNTMYLLFLLLGLLGILIMLGCFYRISIFLFALGWSLVYFMQKTNYNNHYYLLMLVSWFMVWMPAHRYLSIDVRLRPALQAIYMRNWNRLLFIAQLFLVYTFAAIAKIYPGWYNGTYLHIRFHQSANWFKHTLGWADFAALLDKQAFALLLSWLGMAFDFLIIPLLLWKPTQKYAFIAAIIFHGFNSLTLQIGIFPYFALLLSLFCFTPASIQKIFLPHKPFFPAEAAGQLSQKQRIFPFLFCFYLLWQIYLPLRHWFIPGDVLWTEEGHRLSWRMMLRSKSGILSFFITDKRNGQKERVDLKDYLTKEQIDQMTICPDMVWQFAQHLKQAYQKRGQDVAVTVYAKVSVNGSRYTNFIDPAVDLSQEKWHYFSHQPWLLSHAPSNYPAIRTF